MRCEMLFAAATSGIQARRGRRPGAGRRFRGFQPLGVQSSQSISRGGRAAGFRQARMRARVLHQWATGLALLTARLAGQTCNSETAIGRATMSVAGAGQWRCSRLSGGPFEARRQSSHPSRRRFESAPAEGRLQPGWRHNIKLRSPLL